MNQDQVIAGIASLAKIGGTLLVARGTVTGDQWQEIVGGITTALAVWHTHATNATPPGEPPGRSGASLKVCFLLLLPALLLATGCMTSKTKDVVASTNTVNGVTTTNYSTNVLVTVNAANLALDCAGIQTGVGFAVSLTVAKDPAAKPVLLDIQTAITGILAGANTNTVSQLAALFGSSTNASVVANLAPVVSGASSLEQSLLKKYGAAVAGQIGVAIVTAVGNGITAGL